MYVYQIKIPEKVTEMEIDSGEGDPKVYPVKEGEIYPLTCTEEGIGLQTEVVSECRIRVSKIALKVLFAPKPRRK